MHSYTNNTHLVWPNSALHFPSCSSFATTRINICIAELHSRPRISFSSPLLPTPLLQYGVIRCVLIRTPATRVCTCRNANIFFFFLFALCGPRVESLSFSLSPPHAIHVAKVRGRSCRRRAVEQKQASKSTFASAEGSRLASTSPPPFSCT